MNRLLCADRATSNKEKIGRSYCSFAVAFIVHDITNFENYSFIFDKVLCYTVMYVILKRSVGVVYG